MIPRLRFRLWNNTKKRFEDEFEYPKDGRKKVVDAPEIYYLALEDGEIFYEKWDTNGVIAYGTDLSYIPPYDEIIPLQCIGRNDCDDEPIFEGYIVLIEKQHYNNYWDVVWDERSAGFIFILRGIHHDTEFISNVKSKDMTIVGNIFQNEKQFKNE